MKSHYRIFGAGEWGSAIAEHLYQNTNKVDVFVRNKSSFLKSFNLHQDINVLELNDDINQLTCSDNHINLIACSSSGFLSIVRNYKEYFSKSNFISWITKGIDHNSGLLFHQILDNEISPSITKCMISGPSFASDLIDNKEIQVSLASTNINESTQFINSIQSDYFKLVVTSDIIGVQISAIIKNICAILAGILSENYSKKAVIENLMKYGKDEIINISGHIENLDERYKVDSNIRSQTIDSPACHGDLALTCLNDTSRNRTFGSLLARNNSINDILFKLGTVEGYLCTKTLYMNKNFFKSGPIVNSAYRILYENSAPSNEMKFLIDG